MKNETFVIRYRDSGVKYELTWIADSQGDAIDEFWSTFDYKDAKKVSDVHIFRLVEVICDTTNPKVR